MIEVDAFRNELRTPPAEASAPAPREAPVQKKPVTLAEVQAQITAEAAAMPSRWMEPEPAKPAVAEDQWPSVPRRSARPTSGRRMTSRRRSRIRVRGPRGGSRAARHTGAGEHRPAAGAPQERTGPAP